MRQKKEWTEGEPRSISVSNGELFRHHAYQGYNGERSLPCSDVIISYDSINYTRSNLIFKIL